MAFEKVRSIKGGKGSAFGSIDKAGRLLVPHVVATTADAKPGTYFELMVDRDASQVLARPVPYETAYSVKASCTGKVSSWKEKDKDGRTPNLLIGLRPALQTMGATIVRRLRVSVEWSADLQGIVVQLPEPETVASELAVTP